MKRKLFAASPIFAVALSSLLLIAGTSDATFQNWQSDAFKEKPVEKEAPLRQEVPERDRAYLDRAEDEEEYYEAIAPKDMERDHDYLMHDHPLQEAPLPDKQVE